MKPTLPTDLRILPLYTLLVSLRNALFCALAGAFMVAAQAQPLATTWLVTPQESSQYQGNPSDQPESLASGLHVKGVAPSIELLHPDLSSSQKVHAPFAIEVLFKSPGDATIDTDSFKVLYGALKFDITQRIASRIQLSQQGFHLPQAQIPPGKHRLLIQIRDSKDRLAELDLRVEVD